MLTGNQDCYIQDRGQLIEFDGGIIVSQFTILFAARSNGGLDIKFDGLLTQPKKPTK